MSKATVTRLFIGSVAAVVAGVVLGVAAAIAAYASGSLILTGPDVTGIESTTFAWAMVVTFAVAILVVMGGAVGGLVAWIGALLNTAEIEDKTWFILLLVLGLFSFGFVAMIAYVIAGPDGSRVAAGRVPAR